MNKWGNVLVIVATLALGAHTAHAIIVIGADFPTAPSNGATATGEAQLSQLVALYQNDVALLANSDENYSEVIRETKPDAAVQEQLKQEAAKSGALSLETLTAAVTTLVKANPENANVIVASAVALLADLPGGPSQESRVVVGKAALAGIPEGAEKRDYIAALIIGVSASGQDQTDITKTVVALRNFALGDLPENRKVDGSVALDGALVLEGILISTAATPEFRDLALAFVPLGSEPADGEFSGDPGAINSGPGAGGTGAGGGSGSNGGGASPTPTPSPTPVS